MIARNIIAIIVVTSLGASVRAQTLVQAEVPPDARRQVDIFSSSLRAAVINAGQQLADRAKQVVPDIMLRFETEPAIFGAWMPKGEGVNFIVDVPAIEATSAAVWHLLNQRRPVVPVAAGNGVAVPVVPMSPPDPVVPPMTNPEQEYSEFTRQALVDAMLTNAFALPLKDGQSLTVIVGVIDTGRSSATTEVRKRLYLIIKSEDLAALKTGRIMKDEARKRIQEFRY